MSENYTDTDQKFSIGKHAFFALAGVFANSMALSATGGYVIVHKRPAFKLKSL